MEVRFDNTNSIQKTSVIAYSNPLFFKIFDSIEGDMNLYVRLMKDTEDNRSYTRYSIKDTLNSEVLIYNAPDDRYVTTNDPIHLGTLQGRYNLMLKYNLRPVDQRNQRDIILEFYLINK